MSNWYYAEFCFFPNIRLRQVRKTSLYGFWRVYGDEGECRTIREWLEDFKWEIVKPTKEDLGDLNLFMGHDEFWAWSSGKTSEHKVPEEGYRSVFVKLVGKIKDGIYKKRNFVCAYYVLFFLP